MRRRAVQYSLSFRLLRAVLKMLHLRELRNSVTLWYIECRKQPKPRPYTGPRVYHYSSSFSATYKATEV